MPRSGVAKSQGLVTGNQGCRQAGMGHGDARSTERLVNRNGPWRQSEHCLQIQKSKAGQLLCILAQTRLTSPLLARAKFCFRDQTENCGARLGLHGRNVVSEFLMDAVRFWPDQPWSAGRPECGRSVASGLAKTWKGSRTARQPRAPKCPTAHGRIAAS